MNKHRTIGLIISVSIFLISLTQETFHIDREAQPNAWSGGLGNLLMGWLGGNVSWLANLMIIPAWILTSKKTIYPILLSFIAMLLAFSFYFNGTIISNEAGHEAHVTKYLVGYWLWLLSMLVYFIYHIIK